MTKATATYDINVMNKTTYKCFKGTSTARCNTKNPGVVTCTWDFNYKHPVQTGTILVFEQTLVLSYEYTYEKAGVKTTRTKYIQLVPKSHMKNGKKNMYVHEVKDLGVNESGWNNYELEVDLYLGDDPNQVRICKFKYTWGCKRNNAQKVSETTDLSKNTIEEE